MKTPKNNNNKDLPMLSTAHADVVADNRKINLLISIH